MSNRVQYLNWTCNSSVLQITLRGIIFNTDREKEQYIKRIVDFVDYQYF